MSSTSPHHKRLFGADSLEGRWSLNNEKLQVAGSLGREERTLHFEIIGEKIFQRSQGENSWLEEVGRPR